MIKHKSTCLSFIFIAKAIHNQAKVYRVLYVPTYIFVIASILIYRKITLISKIVLEI